MDSRVKAAALSVRENVEAFALFWARGMRQAEISTTLTGACAIASFTLWKALRAVGIDAIFVRGWYHGCIHCWVVVDDQVVDTTATQFGIGEKVYAPHVDEDDGYQYLATQWVTDRVLPPGSLCLLNEKGVEETRSWDAGQSPLLPKYRQDLETIISLAARAAELDGSAESV